MIDAILRSPLPTDPIRCAMTACVSSRSSVSSSPRVTRIVESSTLSPVIAAFVSGCIDEQHVSAASRRRRPRSPQRGCRAVSPRDRVREARARRCDPAPSRRRRVPTSPRTAVHSVSMNNAPGTTRAAEPNVICRTSRLAVPASIASTARGIASASCFSDSHVSGESGETTLTRYATEQNQRVHHRRNDNARRNAGR